MFHLPSTHDDQNTSLSKRPPKHTLICALTCLTKSLLAILKKKEKHFSMQTFFAAKAAQKVLGLLLLVVVGKSFKKKP